MCTKDTIRAVFFVYGTPPPGKKYAVLILIQSSTHLDFDVGKKSISPGFHEGRARG